MKKLELFRKVLKIRGYSESSILNYISALNKFLAKNGFDFSESALRDYFYRMRLDNYSTSTIRMALMAVKLYLKLIENRDFENTLLKNIRREHKLPNVLAKSRHAFRRTTLSAYRKVS